MKLLPPSRTLVAWLICLGFAPCLAHAAEKGRVKSQGIFTTEQLKWIETARRFNSGQKRTWNERGSLLELERRQGEQGGPIYIFRKRTPSGVTTLSKRNLEEAFDWKMSTSPRDNILTAAYASDDGMVGEATEDRFYRRKDNRHTLHLNAHAEGKEYFGKTASRPSAFDSTEMSIVENTPHGRNIRHVRYAADPTTGIFGKFMLQEKIGRQWQDLVDDEPVMHFIQALELMTLHIQEELVNESQFFKKEL